jgi:hypothetical protein
MWLFTTIGFFSATLTNPRYKELPEEQQTDHIMVRARVHGDLERLVDLYERLGLIDETDPSPEILALPGHDYPYRIVIPQQHWTELAGQLAEDIDYSNFKSAVEKQAPSRSEGHARHDLYMKIWGVMHRAEDWLKKRASESRRRGQGRLSFSRWTTPKGFEPDPRTHGDLTAQYGRGWEEWGDEALPEGTDSVFDPSDPFDVVDAPTQDDIAGMEAALQRPDTRRTKK